MPTAQRNALFALLMLVGLVNIDQPFPEVAPLHHIPTLLMVLGAPWWLRRWPLSTPALICFVAFFALHSFGARWTYSSVPYDDWVRWLSGTDTREIFGWTRNHYDRLVHIAFGALLLPATCTWLSGFTAQRGALITAGAILLLAIGGAYEIFEWLLTLVMDPAVAEAYNGQQGDMWDAQKDMALGLAGSLAAGLWLARAPGWMTRPSVG
jgi:putative membrane protein